MAGKRNKGILHKVFNDCAEYATDDFWADFLKKCAAGKFPRGVKYENGVITCRRSKIVFTESIPEKPEEALKIILVIFGEKLGIRSKTERKVSRDKFDKYRKSIVIKDWKSIKRKAVKTSMINVYVMRQKKKYNLTNDEACKMLYSINAAISLGTIKPVNVIMEDGKIICIDGVFFDEYSRTTYIPNIPKRKKLNPTTLPLDMTPTIQINYAEKIRDYSNYCRDIRSRL